MAKQTINIGSSPNDGTGTPLRTAFDYTNQNFTELYTATGPSGNNIVVPGSATITGDLTVDTSTLVVDSTKNRVGIGTASPATRFVVSGGRTGLFSGDAFSLALAQTTGQANYLYLGTDASGTLLVSESNGNSVMTLSQSGVCNWLDGAGGTRMTLNSTGLGVGATPAQKLTVLTNIGISASTATAADDRLVFSENMGSVNLGSQIVWQNSSFLTPYASIGVSNGAAGSNGTLIFSTCSSIFTNTNTERVRIKPTGQVRFFPLAADPAGAEAGDVYYNSSSNKLKCYNGSTWNDLF